MVELAGKTSGRVSEIKVLHKDGNATIYDGFNNLLLDRFFATLGGNKASYISVGTGSVTPVVTDSALTSRVATSPSISWASPTSSISGNIVTASCTGAATFPIGGVVAILSELGLGANSSGTELVAKTLIKDSGGATITIPVTIEDQLIISWTIQYSIDCSPQTYTTTINGVSTQVQINFCRMFAGAIWYTYSGLYFPVTSFIKLTHGATGSSIGTAVVPTDPTQAMSNVTIPDAGNYKTLTAVSTNPSSGVNIVSFKYQLAGSDNAPNGIGAVFLRTDNSGQPANYCCLLYRFTPAVVKLSTFAFTVEFKLTWSR